MFTYYKPIVTNDHYWFAYELAQMCAIYTTTGNPHSKFVIALMDDYFRKNGRTWNLYYETRNGLSRVFPEEDFFAAISPFESIEKNKAQTVSVGRKRFKVIFYQWD